MGYERSLSFMMFFFTRAVICQLLVFIIIAHMFDLVNGKKGFFMNNKVLKDILKSDMSDRDKLIQIADEVAVLSRLGRPPETERLDEMALKVSKLLKAGKSLSDIKKLLDISHSTAWRYKKRARELGYITEQEKKEGGNDEQNIYKDK